MAVTPQMELPMARRLVSLGGSLKMRQRHHRERQDKLDGDEAEAHAADAEDVAEDELGGDEDDAELEPEFIGGDAGAEDAGEGEGVREDEAEDDGPEDVLDAREVDVVDGAEPDAEGLEAFAGEADAEEKKGSGNEREDLSRSRRLAGCGGGQRDGVGGQER